MRACILTLFLGTGMTVFGQLDTTITLDQLRAPSSPGSVLLGVAESDIQRPTDPVEFSATLQQASNDYTQLPKNFAVDIAPWLIWGKPKSAREILGLDKSYAAPKENWSDLGTNLVRTFTLSIAVKDLSGSADAEEAIVQEQPQTGIGFKCSLFRGTATDGSAEQLKALGSAIEDIARVANLQFGNALERNPAYQHILAAVRETSTAPFAAPVAAGFGADLGTDLSFRTKLEEMVIAAGSGDQGWVTSASSSAFTLIPTIAPDQTYTAMIQEVATAISAQDLELAAVWARAAYLYALRLLAEERLSAYGRQLAGAPATELPYWQRSNNYYAAVVNDQAIESKLIAEARAEMARNDVSAAKSKALYAARAYEILLDREAPTAVAAEIHAAAEQAHRMASTYKMEREGFFWDIAGGLVLDHKDRRFDNSYITKAGLWTSLGNNSKKANITYQVQLRYLFQPDNPFLAEADSLEVKDIQLADGGARFSWDPNNGRFSLSLEALYRRAINTGAIDPTWRLVTNAGYDLGNNKRITFSFGRNFDATTTKSGNLITALNLILGFGHKTSSSGL